MEVIDKRVLLIASEFPPSPGGIGQHAFSLAQGLSRRSIDVTVLTDEQGAGIENIRVFDSAQLFKVIRIPRRFPYFYFHRIAKAFSLVKKVRPNTILVSGKFSLWIGAILKLALRCHVVCILHGSEVRLSTKLLRWATGASIGIMDKIVCVSSFTKRLLPENIRQAKPIEVIPNGIEFSEFQNLKREAAFHLKGDPSLLTIGNVSPRKGQHRVIQSLPELTKAFPDIHYHSIGIPTVKDRLERLAHELGVSKFLTFHGKIKDRSEMLSLAKTAGIFVMLSENQRNGDVEGFGIAILEANALGIPAIGARGSGIEDAIKEGFNGILVEGNDPVEIVEAVRTISKGYRNYSANAISWAKQHDMAGTIDKYLIFSFPNE